jgi:hypothetical protein
MSHADISTRLNASIEYNENNMKNIEEIDTIARR